MKILKKLILIVFFAVLIFLIPVIINELYKLNRGYTTVWGGADVLSFYGSILGSVGTIVLGIVAWKQNERLLMVEENSFLAQNAGAALITELIVNEIGSTACNFDQHVEQIIFTDEVLEKTNFFVYKSFSITCKMEPMDSSQHITLIRVNEVVLMASLDGEEFKSVISAERKDNEFSRVAISKEYDAFQITLIMSKREKEDFISQANDAYSRLFIDMKVTLLTDKFVATELQCRANLSNPGYDSKEDMYSHFQIDQTQPPLCFWHGVTLMKKEEIVIKERNG